MDRAFLLEGLKALIPITLIFCAFYVFTPMTGDFNFHILNTGEKVITGEVDYPPAVSWLLSLGEVVFGRPLALFLLLLTATTIIPYLLVVRIVAKTHDDWKMKAGWIFLYGSGVPFVTLFGGIAAQALIMCLMLFAVLEPAGMVLLLMLGPYVYREWALAFAATFAYVAFQYLKPRIPAGWFN